MRTARRIRHGRADPRNLGERARSSDRSGHGFRPRGARRFQPAREAAQSLIFVFEPCGRKMCEREVEPRRRAIGPFGTFLPYNRSADELTADEPQRFGWEFPMGTIDERAGRPLILS